VKKTRLRKVSQRKQRERQLYAKIRLEFLLKNPYCQVCQKALATQIHHKLPLGRGGKLCDVEIFLAVCPNCHDRITNNPQWAKEKGYTLASGKA